MILYPSESQPLLKGVCWIFRGGLFSLFHVGYSIYFALIGSALYKNRDDDVIPERTDSFWQIKFPGLQF